MMLTFRKSLLGNMFLLFPMFLSAQNLFFSSFESVAQIEGDHLSIMYYSPDTEDLVLKFPVLSIRKDSFLRVLTSEENEGILLLSHDHLFAYINDLQYPAYMGCIGASSSECEEGLISLFPSSPLNSLSLEDPWIGSQSGWETDNGYIKSLVISSGFISIDQPEKYLYYSRLKEIRIKTSEDEDSQMFHLSDTPDLQIIDLGTAKQRNLQIEIIDVYPGIKSPDTCINFMIGRVW